MVWFQFPKIPLFEDTLGLGRSGYVAIKIDYKSSCVGQPQETDEPISDEKQGFNGFHTTASLWKRCLTAPQSPCKECAAGNLCGSQMDDLGRVQTDRITGGQLANSLRG